MSREPKGAWLVKRLIMIGSVCGALVAIATFAFAIGLPRPALSTDINRLDRQQTEQAVELYNQKVRSLIVQAPANFATPQAQRLYEEELNHAKDQLKRSEERKIELSK